MSRRKKIKPRAVSKRSFLALWWESKGPLIQFGLKFFVITLLFYGISFISYCQDFLSASVSINAQISSGIVNLLGERSHITSDATLWAGRYAILKVEPACTSIEFSWFYCAAVLAFPAPLLQRILGLLVGVILLLALNLVRIISLYFVGVHWRTFFDTVHQGIWPIALDVLTFLLMIVWLRWVSRNQSFTVHASA